MKAEIDDFVAVQVFSRYRQMGVIPGWSRERLLKLSELANRTPEEIGAMAGLKPTETRSALERGKFTPAASLIFAMIDSSVKEVKFGEPSVPLIPLDLLILHENRTSRSADQPESSAH